MDISLKQALKAPFSWKLLIVALLALLPTIYVLQISQHNPNALTESNIIVGVIINLICTLLIAGYTVLFGHNRIHNNPVLFPDFSWKLIKVSLKNIVFGLGTYVIVFLGVGLFFLINALPVYIALPLNIALIVFGIFYLFASTARFLDTLLMKAPFQIMENCRLLKGYWTTFLRIFLYNLGVIIILIIPFILLTALLYTMVKMNPNAIYAGIFMISLMRIYIAFVGINVFAQGYSWIKADQASKATVVPVIAPKIMAVSQKVVPVKAKAKPTPVKGTKTTTKAKSSVKKAVPVETVKPIIKAKAAPKKTVRAKKKV